MNQADLFSLTGAGSAPLFGDTNQTEGFTLTNLESSVEWNWDTQYWLDVVTFGAGMLLGIIPKKAF